MGMINPIPQDLGSHQLVFVDANTYTYAPTNHDKKAKILIYILTAVTLCLLAFILITLHFNKLNAILYEFERLDSQPSYSASPIEDKISKKQPTSGPQQPEREALPSVSLARVEHIGKHPAEKPIFSKSKVTPYSSNKPVDDFALNKQLNIQTNRDEYQHVVGLNSKARVALQNNDLSTATVALQELLLVKPNDHALLLLLSRVHYRSGNTKAALSLLQVTPQNPNIMIEFLDFRAALANESGDYYNAINDYQTLVNIQPNNFRWPLQMAVTFDKRNEFADAIFAYEQLKTVETLPAKLHSFVELRLKVLRSRV